MSKMQHGIHNKTPYDTRKPILHSSLASHKSLNSINVLARHIKHPSPFLNRRIWWASSIRFNARVNPRTKKIISIIIYDTSMSRSVGASRVPRCRRRHFERIKVDHHQDRWVLRGVYIRIDKMQSNYERARRIARTYDPLTGKPILFSIGADRAATGCVCVCV